MNCVAVAIATPNPTRSHNLHVHISNKGKVKSKMYEIDIDLYNAVYLKGPIGIPNLLTALSMRYGSVPCSTRNIAACVYGKNILLTANPVQFPTTTGVFLIFFPTSNRSTITWAEV